MENRLLVFVPFVGLRGNDDNDLSTMTFLSVTISRLVPDLVINSLSWVKDVSNVVFRIEFSAKTLFVNEESIFRSRVGRLFSFIVDGPTCRESSNWLQAAFTILEVFLLHLMYMSPHA